MRFSKFFAFTLREAPQDAVVASHVLMVRAGMIMKVAAGIYNYLPLGLRVLRKVEKIVREEMNHAGAQELIMPVVTPSELWEESERWNKYGPELLRLKDRRGGDFCLGPTHEEVITDIVRREIRSYKQLPVNLYQIQTKFRDEIRPRFGLMRGREFTMKDAYSFHVDEEDAKREYKNMYDTYSRIFARCGLKFRAVFAETGAIGGTLSHEFQVLAETGEDLIASCPQCEYAANVNLAEIGGEIVLTELKGDEPQAEKVSTPRMKTVEEVTHFLKVKPENLIKSLIYLADGKPLTVLVRGDHEVNENKLQRSVKCAELKLADSETIQALTHADVGFSGPVGLNVKIIADRSIASLKDAVTGANINDMHLMHVYPQRDFKVEKFEDLRMVKDGDICPRCGAEFSFFRGIEVGQVFFLGTKYSKTMRCSFYDEEGREHPMIMGCYGIGIGRTACAAIEQNHDEQGIIWPMPIAPFHVIVLALQQEDPKVVEVSEQIYRELKTGEVEVLFDDRDERAGVKFNDADLIGIPIRVTVGKNSLKKGKVEIKLRNSKNIELISPQDCAKRVKEIVREEMEKCRV